MKLVRSYVGIPWPMFDERSPKSAPHATPHPILASQGPGAPGAEGGGLAKISVVFSLSVVLFQLVGFFIFHCIFFD